jgi:hypothetical protein
VIALAVLAAAMIGGSAPESPVPVPPPGPARDRAVAALRSRAESAAPGSPDASRVAGQIERIGAACLAENDLARASELLSEAYTLDEDNGLVLAELTLCYLRSDDDASARFYLRRTEERAVHAPPEAYAVLGDVYLGLHRLDDAVFAWEEFVRLGGTDPEVLGRLYRARDELAVSRGQRSRRFDHFVIYADPDVEPSEVEAVGAELEAAYAREAELLGSRLTSPQIVVLYAGRAYFSLVSVPDWSSGFYDGKIRVSVDPVAAGPGSMTVLRHELAHALLRAAGPRFPAWFHEGVAQWCEGRRLPVREVRAAVTSQPATSSRELDRLLVSRHSRASVRAGYAQALSLFEFLVAERGSGAIACLIDDVAIRGVAFGDALAGEAGISEGDLFGRWRRWAGV